MTRETKVGIVVALAFVLLIAGVLAYKIYVLGEGLPAVADAAANQAASPNTAPQPTSRPPARPPAQPPQPEPPAAQLAAPTVNAPASIALIGPFLQQIHEGSNTLADASTQSFMYLLSKHENAAAPVARPMTAPEAAAPSVASNPPAPMPPAPPATNREAPTTATSPSPLASRPPVNSSAKTDDAKQPAAKTDAALNASPSAAAELTKNDPLPAASPPPPEPPAMKTPDSFKPPMPSPVVDGTLPAADAKTAPPNPTAVNGASNGNRPAATLSPPQPKSAPPVADGPPAKLRPPDGTSSGGIPVTIRQQPDLPLPPAPPAVAAPSPPRGSSASSAVARNGARVEDYDVVLHDVQPGDTYADLSKKAYGSDRYQAALAAFNHELDPHAAMLVKGQRLRLPPAQVLERRYRNLIPGLPEPPPQPDNKRSAAVEGTRQPARLMPNLGAEQTAPALGAPVPNVNAALPANTSAKDAAQADWAKDAKQYRVQPNDTIWSIAKHTLGKGERWPEISRLNRDVLPDVNQLKAGMTLRLPADAKVDTPETPQ